MFVLLCRILIINVLFLNANVAQNMKFNVQNVKHGSVFEVPLSAKTGGFGYFRVIGLQLLTNQERFKNDYLIQFLTIRNEVSIDDISELDTTGIDIFCDPMLHNGKIIIYPKYKWKYIGLIDTIKHIDYLPYYNQDLMPELGRIIEEDHLVEHYIDGHKRIDYKRVLHLPMTWELVSLSIVQMIHFLWWIELLPDVDDIEELKGGFGSVAKYYHGIFKKLPRQYRGVPLPEGMTLEELLK